MLYIGAETSRADNHWRAFVCAYFTRQLEQLENLFQCDGLHALVLGQLCKLWLLSILGCANLCHRTETPDFHKYRSATLGVCSQFTLTSLVLLTGV